MTLRHLFQRKASNGRLRSLIGRLLERGLKQTAAQGSREDKDLNGERTEGEREGQMHRRAHRGFLVPRRPRDFHCLDEYESERECRSEYGSRTWLNGA